MYTKEELRFKILMCFFKFSKENRKITKMAQSLGLEKYEMSRQVALLESEGLIDRSDSRNMVLTPKGRKIAETYANHMELAINHLTYEGIDPEDVKHDALVLTLNCSDSFFDRIQQLDETMRMKEYFSYKAEFSGKDFCEEIKEGTYSYPFIIYREKIKGKTNISMANKAFLHPCEVIISEGGGIILLKAVEMSAPSGLNGIEMKGRCKRLEYFDGKQFIEVFEENGFLQLPLEYFHFVNIGTDTMDRVLHGSICLRMCCTVGPLHMPESTAIFTVFVH